MSNMVKLLYRRVSPGQWRTDDPQTPEESLFYRRPNEESLSVFDAEMATPTAVLEHLLNLWIKQNRRGKLKECGGTIKGLRELGWGVVAFEVDSPWLEQFGFALGVPDSLGHLQIIGDETAFEQFAPLFVDKCRRVNEAEYEEGEGAVQ